MEKEILNMEEAAELFGVSIKTFIKLLKEENVPARKIGREWRFSGKALVEWLSIGNSRDYSSSDNDSRQYFDKVAPQWEEISRDYYDQSIVNKLVDLNLLDKGQTVVDYGCGDGYIARGISQYVSQVIALDISQAMLDELNRKAFKAGIQNIVALECEENDLPVRASSVDLVCASMILHHIEEPKEIISQFYRILKTGGKVFVADFHSHDDGPFKLEMHDIWPGFETGEIAGWLEKEGFRQIDIESLGSGETDKKPIFIITAVKV